MRKIIIILTFFVCGITSAQQWFFNGTVYVPKTTAQINAIVSPVEGRFESNSDTGSMWYYNGSEWVDTFSPPLDASPTDGSTNGVESGGVYDALATKQATLISGTNIKTINSTSLLGSGNITTPNIANSTLIATTANGIQVGSASGSSQFNIKTLNSTLMRFDGDQTGGGAIYLYDKYDDLGHGAGAYVNLISELSGKVNSSGAVTSVQGQTGAVVIDPDDLDDTATTHKFATAAQLAQIGTNTSDILDKADDDAVVHKTGSESISGNKVFSGSNSVTGSMSFNGTLLGTGTFNMQNGDVQLSGNLLEENNNTVITTGSDPGGQASLLFSVGGSLLPLTAKGLSLNWRDDPLLISNTSEVTGSDQITNLISATETELTANPPSATTIAVCPDCSPAASFTGTVIPLDGYYQRDDTLTDTASWTLGTDVRNGASVEILIDMASEPSITGDVPIPNTQAFVANTLMVLTIKVVAGQKLSFYTALE